MSIPQEAIIAALRLGRSPVGGAGAELRSDNVKWNAEIFFLSNVA